MSIKGVLRFFSTESICKIVCLTLICFNFWACSLQRHGSTKSNTAGNTAASPKDTSHRNPKDTTSSKQIGKDSAALKAALKNGKDTSKTARDSAAAHLRDSVPTSPSALGSDVKYNAKDSIIFDVVNKKVYLYGNAHMDYTDITLDAEYITIDYISNTICAQGGLDSNGRDKNMPKFKQGDQVFNSRELCYNFKTKKGRIKELFLKEGEGYIHVDTSKVVKINGKDVIYGKGAKYTTCDLPDDPHFYIETGKMKLVAGEKVITGPAYIVMEGVPLPIVLPFGFFPANSRKTSGIIIPSYGESATQGFALRGGGFYFGNSNYYDAALTGDIYTGGSYLMNLKSRYADSYRFAGGLNLSYARNQIGYKETKDFQVQENYFIDWTHNQDVKANPGSTFAVSVHAGSSNYLKQNTYNPTSIATQALASSISYSKRFTGTPFSLNSSLNHSQNLGTGAVDFTLPNVNFAMSRINPFKSSHAVGKHWYDDINVTYNLNFKNLLHTSDSTIHEDLTPEKFQNGFQQTIPIQTSLRVLKYFTLTPSINYDGYLYTTKFVKAFDTLTNQLVNVKQTHGLYYASAYGANISLTTMIYGMYTINSGKLIAFRHVLTPVISASWRPDFGLPSYGYYADYVNLRDHTTGRYSVYDNGVIGSPAAGKQGSINVDLQNNFELKVKNPKDTANPTKKIKVLDYFDLASSYNFLADSFQLSPVSFSARTTLFDRFGIQGDARLDPYHMDETGKRYKEYDFSARGLPGRVTDMHLNLTANLNHKAATAKSRVMPVYNPFTSYYYPEPYANFDVPWNAALGYTGGYTLGTVLNSYTGRMELKKNFDQVVNVSGDLNLTSKWKIVVATGYSLTTKDFTLSKINIYRDLHCWEMSFEWVPFGPYRSYFFNIHIKAPSLQDLKLDKRRTFNGL
jgi:lipopolysaccharide assembly outer membrane protein LptD (OstA)